MATARKVSEREEEGVQNEEQHKANGKADSNGLAKKGNEEHSDKRQKTDAIPEGVLEDGQIFFLYRPRVAFKEAHSLSDVQRFYFVMQPDKGSKKRLVVVGKKKLPAPRERFFGFVEAVSERMEDLTGEMGAIDNETKTQGTRHTEPARIAGQGSYSIAEKDGSRTYLVWKLEVPEQPGQVQEDLCISKEGTLALSIKNPKKPNPGPANIGLDTKADFGEKQKAFDGMPGGYAWTSAKDPSMLDYVNAELLLIGAGDDIEGQVGKAVETHLSDKVGEAVQKAKAEVDGHGDDEAKLVEEMKRELKADGPGLEDAPAETREWK